jgi:tRNA modification GTPase
MSAQSPTDTIVALATAPGESGIGVVRLSGPAAISIARAHFKPRQSVDLATAATQTSHVGQFVATEPVDQVVITLFRAPHSYTGDDVVEISAHGSPFILDQILHCCVRSGARMAEPGEFTLRAFLAGKIDLTQAEAVADLIRARSDQANAAALGQLEGRLAEQVRRLRDQLLPLLAHVEVGLDHSDEDHDFLSREGLISGCKTIRGEIEALLNSARVGRVLREGVRVAIVGRPNVGKSSLLNALLKEDRAIVTAIPGTTRDTLEETFNWDGIPVILTDTAGLRDAVDDPIERLGIERSKKALQRADLALCLFDASAPLDETDKRLIAECAAKPHVWVMNKLDLPARWRADQLSALNGGGAVVEVSAKTGSGLDVLVNTVKALSIGQSTAADARWMLNARHQAALEKARTALQEAEQTAGKNSFEECVALELNTVLQALGEVIGETATEELLGQIFSQFCIGK